MTRATLLLTVMALMPGIVSADTVPMYRDGRLVAVETTRTAADLHEAVGRLLLPDPTMDVDRLLPAETLICEVRLEEEDLYVVLDVPANFLGSRIDDELLERLSRQFDLGLMTHAPEFRHLHLLVADPENSGRYLSLASFIETVPVPVKEADTALTTDAPPRQRLSDGPYPLSDKVLFISQAHGWIDYDTSDAWETQRGITNGIVEDFVNAEAINQYLLHYLENAGAFVFPLRERDLTTSMVIVDDGDGSAYPGNGFYVESGDLGVFSNSGHAAFDNFHAPYGATTNPFRDTGGTDRLMTTTLTETARATWVPVIPETGSYDVWVSYTRDGAARASDAHYIVNHSGGETHVRINQELHGWVWVHLGRFHFEAGAAAAFAGVALVNDSAEVGDTVSADAVRFGGGFGDVLGPHHAITSGHPRWEEGARPWVQFMGAPSSVWSGGDVTARSRFAAWEHYAVEDSVYLSWHSNAYDGTVRGTSSYIYSANPPNGTFDPEQSTIGSPELQEAVHDEIINDIRGEWEAGWADRGYRSAYFGEINPAHNNEMPSLLLEVAFHDNATDAAALADPRFRRLLARSIYQGIVTYFADRDDTPLNLLPEPPQAPCAGSENTGEISVSWLASPTDGGGVLGDAATSYRVALSDNGYGFDEGVEVTETSVTLGGLEPGAIVYLRITALNAGGESLPSETLAIRIRRTADEPRLLLVSAFDRLDRYLLVEEYEDDLGGAVDRMFLDRMNRFSYLVEHAEALRSSGLGFDSCSNDAIIDGRVRPASSTWPALIWELGEESTVDETFDGAEQAAVTSYLAGGGMLLVSGAEIAWDLDFHGSVGDQLFYRQELGSRYVADDADTYEVMGVAGSLFDGVGPFFFDDGTQGSYQAQYADVIDPEGDSTTCLIYGTGGGAATCRDDGVSKVVTMAFPFETIYPAATREVVMERVMDFFGFEFSAVEIFSDGFERGDTNRWSDTADSCGILSHR